MSAPEVTIEQGKLRGSAAKDIKGDDFFKFQGIPYAKPPLGELRFKAPQPPENWSGTWDATKVGDRCYAIDPFNKGEIGGSENCLNLNVYTKKLPSSASSDLKPVLFWIYGGGFTNGSGDEELYAPHFLITEDVVVVTINYRLGLLGFVSFEDPSLEVPGNAGFKDQVLALKWVQKNISKFGGDPNNVTIFGQSAGAVSVNLLVLSPTAKGLFHKAISQSGCASSLTVRGTTDIKLLATALGLEEADERTIYNTLMEKSTEELLQIQDQVDSLGGFKPEGKRKISGWVVEKNGKEPFLDQEPEKITLSGKFNQVPYMVGYTTCELLLYVPPSKEDVNFENYIPWYFGYEVGTPASKAAAKKVETFYFGPGGYNDLTKDNFYNLISDYFLVYEIHETVLKHYSVSKAPTYMYRMSIDTELNFFKRFYRITRPGVAHLDDIGYLFKNFTTPEIKPGSVEEVSMLRFVKLWTNFAKFGNPTPERNDALLKTVWKPVTDTKLDFLDIGEELVALTDPDGDRWRFWRQLYAESPAGQKGRASK